MVDVHSLLKINSWFGDLEANTSDDPNKQIKFCEVPEPTRDTIPESDEKGTNFEIQIATQTPPVTQLSLRHKKKSISNSYLNQFKLKKNSVGSMTENNLVNSCNSKVYGNDLSVEKEKEQVIIPERYLSMTW